MAEKPDESYCLFGAEALLKRLRALVAEIPGVRQAEDIECVHRMRVASRRLRAAFRLFADCWPPKQVSRWQRQIRRITRALGEARDADVQIAAIAEILASLPDARLRPGVARLLLRLRQRRDGLQPHVLQALDQLEVSGVIQEMEQAFRETRVRARLRQTPVSSPYVYQQACLSASMRLEDLLAYESYVDQPERVQELHAMRIEAKRLRYTLEVFAPLYEDGLDGFLKAVREAQTLLGDLHDCDVWLQYLPQFIEEERQRTLAYLGHTRPLSRLLDGLRYLEENRRRERERVYHQFSEQWARWREHHTWEALQQALRAPLADSIRPAAPAPGS